MRQVTRARRAGVGITLVALVLTVGGVAVADPAASGRRGDPATQGTQTASRSPRVPGGDSTSMGQHGSQEGHLPGSSANVDGSSRAIAPTGPMPGRMPTMVPTSTPMKQAKRLPGVRAIEKP